MAVDWLALKLTVCVPSPGEPVMKSPIWLTRTSAFSGAVGAGVIVILNLLV